EDGDLGVPGRAGHAVLPATHGARGRLLDPSRGRLPDDAGGAPAAHGVGGRDLRPAGNRRVPGRERRARVGRGRGPTDRRVSFRQGRRLRRVAGGEGRGGGGRRV